MLLPCLLFSLLAPSDPVAATPESTLAELRVHDLSAVASTESERGDAPEWLLPFVRPHQMIGGWSMRENELPVLAEDLFSILAGMYRDELEFEGRRIELLADGRVAVRAPAAVHDRLTATLRGLGEALGAEVELAVELVSVPDPASLPAAAILSAEEADELLVRLGAGAPRQTLSVSARADRETLVDLTYDRSLLLGYSVEIAEGSAIHDPIVDLATFGTSLSVRAAPAREGVALALNLRRGELARPVEESDLGLRRELSLEREVVRSSSPAVTQAVELRSSSVSLNTVLRSDEVLAVPRAVETAGGRVAELLLVRRVSGDLRPMVELTREEHGTDALLLNTIALSPPRQVFEGRLLTSTYSPGAFQMVLDDDSEVALASRLVELDQAPLVEVVVGDPDALDVERYGSWIVLLPAPRADEGRFRAQLRGALERFSAALEEAELLPVTVRVVREGTGGPESVASAALPLVSGRASALVLGVERLAVIDYDVEIAKYSAAPTPVTASQFDGLALWLRAARTPAGGVLVEIRGGLNLEELRTRTDLGSGLYDWVDQAGHRQLLVNERRVLPGGSSTPAVFGSRGPGALRLELTIDG